MDWEELLREFRELGGVAENIRLADGPFGRGVFVIDPSKPAVIKTPENLLVPCDTLTLSDGQLTTNAPSLGARERDFFERYERYFGWGAGGFDEAMQAQAAWSRLPTEIVTFIKTMGVLDHPDRRFLEPTIELALYEYMTSRQFFHNERVHLAPVADLVNHSSTASIHTFDRGVVIEGTFQAEVFHRYNVSDAWAHATNYGFSDRNPLAYSIGLSVDILGKQISIKRAVHQVDIRNGVLFPKVEIAGNRVELPHLMLGNAGVMDLPRAVFRKIMESTVTERQADDAFDTIVHFNRIRFINLLRTLRKYHGPLVDMLEEATINQLEALSSNVGVRTLT